MTGLAPANLLALLIRGYQRFISPHKGYACSHRTLHGRGSCSDYGLRLLRDRRLRAFLPLMRRRFGRCRAAAEVLMRRRALSPEFHPDFAGGPD
jgi:putative component of membrane protein insertase Oxa1/YidC/SpoIIIJ protein YidD